MQKLIPHGKDILDGHVECTRNLLDMQALVILRRRLQHMEDLLGHRFLLHAQPARGRGGVVICLVDEHGISIGLATTSSQGLGRAPREVEMHVRRLQEVHADLVRVRDGADDVGGDVALVVKAFDAAEGAHVAVLFDARLDGRATLGVDPLLGFDDASSVVDLVSYVRMLRRNGPDLADEGYLRGEISVSKYAGGG
jgi:hypothetical protein